MLDASQNSLTERLGIPLDPVAFPSIAPSELASFVRKFNSKDTHPLLHPDPDPNRALRLRIFSYQSKDERKRLAVSSSLSAEQHRQPQWTGDPDRPVVLQLWIPDVLVAYVSAGREKGVLVPQYVTCVSPREKVSWSHG